MKNDKTKRRQGQPEANPLSHVANMDAVDLQNLVGQTADKYRGLCEEHDRMIDEGKRQQQEFIRREVQFKSQISRMKDLLDKAVLSKGGDEVGMPKLRETHSKIMTKLGEMQQATRSVMADQEQELIKLFRYYGVVSVFVFLL